MRCFSLTGELRFNGLVIVFAVAREHPLLGGFELARLALEVGPGAALRLGSVRRQLHAVDSEHLTSDQALALADEQNLNEDVGDVLTQRAHESSNGGEVRRTVPGQCNEGDVASAGTLDTRP